MSAVTTRLDGQNVGVRLLGQTSISVLSLHLTTGDVTSTFFTPADCAIFKQFATRLFAIVPVSARPASAIGLLSRLCAVSPADASTLTLTASVSAGVATLNASVLVSPASLILTMPYSADGGVLPGIVTTNASSGGGGQPSGDTILVWSDEELEMGDAVARTPTGRVRQADADDLTRLPAIGMVTGREEDGRYQVQVTGVAPPALYFAGSQSAIYVGLSGKLTSQIKGLSNVQLFGHWLNDTTFVVNIDPRILRRP